MSDAILEVIHVKKHFPIRSGLIKHKIQNVHAVDDVSFSVEREKTLAVVGESGSGKTTLANLIMKFEDMTDGDILFNGESIKGITNQTVKEYRRSVQMVFQDPSSSLNPSKTLEQIIEEPMIIHGIGNNASRKKRVAKLMDIVELPASFAKRNPHTLSGGQKQRVGVARAIALNSKLIVLDEPTSALDVSVQAKVIELLEDIQKELGLTYFFITHDLALVRNFAHDVVVMNKGKVVEKGTVDEVFTNPKDPYTLNLLRAIPVVGPEDEAYLAELGV